MVDTKEEGAADPEVRREEAMSGTKDLLVRSFLLLNCMQLI